jgi:hypothetical protein
MLREFAAPLKEFVVHERHENREIREPRAQKFTGHFSEAPVNSPQKRKTFLQQNSALVFFVTFVFFVD